MLLFRLGRQPPDEPLHRRGNCRRLGAHGFCTSSQAPAPFAFRRQPRRPFTPFQIGHGVGHPRALTARTTPAPSGRCSGRTPAGRATCAHTRGVTGRRRAARAAERTARRRQSPGRPPARPASTWPSIMAGGGDGPGQGSWKRPCRDLVGSRQPGLGSCRWRQLEGVPPKQARRHGAQSTGRSSAGDGRGADHGSGVVRRWRRQRWQRGRAVGLARSRRHLDG